MSFLKNKLLCAGFAFALLLPSHGFAQSVKAYTDAPKIVIGDQVKLWLELNLPNAQQPAQWPAVPEQLGSGLELVEKGKIDTLKSGGGLVLKQRLLVTGFDSGSYFIPSFSFQVGGKVLATDSIALYIQTIAVDTTKDFKPIKEIVTVPFSIWDYWYVMLAMALLVAFGIFIWYYFKKNKANKIPVVQRVPPEKAHEKALRLLSELKGKDYSLKGNSKQFFSELSDVLRTYLEERFNIPAMEQTTDELMNNLKKLDDSKAELRKVRGDLKTVLNTSDLAKFAKANPLPEEFDESIATAADIINRTRVKTEEVKK
ncbi:MAG: hypothetical protein QM642_02100 [Edaphocola sp.]